MSVASRHLGVTRFDLSASGTKRMLLIGPYDPHCGEYTFLAPPLGVWRLKGVLSSYGHVVEVFDPNCCGDEPERALRKRLHDSEWDAVGVSTTGMTLPYDLALAHVVARESPRSVLIAGGMEATFDPELLYRLAPFDLVVLGEGEKPLREILGRLGTETSLLGIPGTAVRLESGKVQRFHGRALSHAELAESIRKIPYADMPYEAYWERLERVYAVDGLPFKAEREARLAEIRSVRMITLNYCPMACSFCSSTNFLHEAQGGVAKIARLDADECIELLESVVAAQPRVRTVIFQDDIFVFTSDKRIADLCAAIGAAKAAGRLPQELQFISTNRIDALCEERLRMMKRAGFRVLGFGVESFSKRVLEEFNKGQIHAHIEPVLHAAVGLRLKPFLDLIMCSPRSTLADVATTVREAHRWVAAGCEIGLYPYVIPFSGARMASDPELASHVRTERRHIAGTALSWDQPAHIAPVNAHVRETMERIGAAYDDALAKAKERCAHLPSRARSLLWIAAAAPILGAAGEAVPDAAAVNAALDAALRGKTASLRSAHRVRQAL